MSKETTKIKARVGEKEGLNTHDVHGESKRGGSGTVPI